MFDLGPHILIVILPLLLSNVMHMIVVKKNWLSVCAKPISLLYFGTNKTWRAFLIVPIFNVLFLVLIGEFAKLEIPNLYLLGLGLGLTYLVFELPNSFIKRRVGIQPGEKGQKYAQLVILIDKMDSAFGVILLYFLMGYIAIVPAIYLFLLAVITHFSISYLLVLFQIKKSI
jgi:CDP-diacylglycerol--serine O-phosphatidyltransferase